MKDKLKLWIDANVWDGEDRIGAKNDCACFNPDELQELIFEMYEYVIPKVKADAIREAFGKLADEYRPEGLKHMYTGFSVARHIKAQSKYYADKLEAGTL